VSTSTIRRFTVFDIESVAHPICATHNHEGEHGMPAATCFRAVSMVMLPIEIDHDGGVIAVRDPIVAGLDQIGQGFDRHDSSEALDELAMRCERHIVETMTKEVRTYWPVLVTWNGRGFDLPMIFAAGFEHGVDLKWMAHEAYRDRYRGRQHLDLQEVFSLGGAGRNARMAFAAQRLGWPGKLDVDGKSVEHLWRTGAFAQNKLVQYNGLDTLQQAAILLRVLLVQGMLAKPLCIAGTEQLIDMARREVFPFDGIRPGHLVKPSEELERLSS
jgi:hypothetical protein